jgi:hypothetical protein
MLADRNQRSRPTWHGTNHQETPEAAAKGCHVGVSPGEDGANKAISNLASETPVQGEPE